MNFPVPSFPTEDSTDRSSPRRFLEDLNWIVRSLRRNYLLPVKAVGAAILLAVVYILIASPRFSATAQLMVNTQQIKVTGGDSVWSELPFDPHMMDTKLAVLNSSEVAKTAFQAIDVPPERLFGGDVPKQDMIERFRKLVKTGQEGLSRVLWVSAEHADPEIAAKIANAFVEAFLADERENKSEVIRLGNAWLEERTRDLRSRTLEAEENIQKYKGALRIVSSGNRTLGELELEEAAKQLVAARQQRIATHARLSQLETAAKGVDRFSSLSDVLDSNVIMKYRELEAETRGRVVKLTSTYGEKDIRVEAANAELNNLKQEINAEINRIIKKYRNEYDVAINQVETLEKDMDELKRRLIEDGTHSLKLMDLTREAEATREIYNSFKKRLNETQGQDTLEVADARIISFAAVPTKPTRPDKVAALLLSTALALGLSFFYILAKETFSAKISGPADVAHQLRLKLLASIPNRRRQKHLEESEIAAISDRQYTSLRFAITQAELPRASRVVAVLSATAGEGRTITAYNLAMNAAAAGLRTVLVDGDFNGADLSRSLTPDAKHGWETHIDGSAELADLFERKDETGLRILPLLLSERQMPVLELVDNIRFVAMWASLKDQFDLVIVDTPMLSDLIELRILLAQADLAVLVVEQDKEIAQNIISKIDDESRFPRERLLGVVLNKSFDGGEGNRRG